MDLKRITSQAAAVGIQDSVGPRSGIASYSRPTSGTRIPWQWLAIGIFMLVSTLNFIDRQLLAAVAPTLRSEFHLSNAQYGSIVSAFSIVYGFATPIAGWFADRFGLNLGIGIAFVIWSLSGMTTGLSHTLRALVVCRMGLGLGESAGVPCAGKAGAMYLDPAELGIAGGFGSAAVSLGAILAPLIVSAIMPIYGWRAVFIVPAALGLIWLPIWLFTAKRIPPRFAIVSTVPPPAFRRLLIDVRLWGIAIAYALVMMVYSLWINWTTIYFVHERRLTQLDANSHFAWIPPAVGIIGGFLGGGLAFYWIRKGEGGLTARLRSCWWLAPLFLFTAAVPFMPSSTLATAAIGISFLAAIGISANIHVMPVDLFGAPRAGFANGIMAGAYALAQTLLSPAIGAVIDHYSFRAVCIAMTLVPFIGLVLMKGCLRVGSAGDMKNLGASASGI